MLSAVATIHGMDESAYKELLRKNVLVAARHRRKYRIAEDVGCSRQTLSTFMSGGPLGPEYRDALETWLKEHGYWIEPDAEDKTSKASIAQRILANELRGLADMLESDMSDSFKADRFMSFVTTYGKAYEAELKKHRPE